MRKPSRDAAAHLGEINRARNPSPHSHPMRSGPGMARLNVWSSPLVSNLHEWYRGLRGLPPNPQNSVALRQAVSSPERLADRESCATNHSWRDPPVAAGRAWRANWLTLTTAAMADGRDRACQELPAAVCDRSITGVHGSMSNRHPCFAARARTGSRPPRSSWLSEPL